MLITVCAVIIVVLIIISLAGRSGNGGRENGNYAKSGGKPAKWTERTHLLSDPDYICSACGGKSDKPYKTCPHCGAHTAKVKWDDKEMHDWLDANPGCDEIDYEEFLECDIWDED